MLLTSTRCPLRSGALPDPGELLPALAHLVGFTPENSLVAIYFDGALGVRLTARLDWQDVAQDVAAVANALRGHADRAQASGVVLVAVGPTREPDGQDGVLSDLVRLVSEPQPGRASPAVPWAAQVLSGRWWTPSCFSECGSRSHAVPEATVSGVVRRYEAIGRVPALDREAVVREVAAVDSGARDDVARALQEGWSSGRTSAATRVDHAEKHLFAATHPPTSADRAEVVAVCQDPAERDVLLWRVTRRHSDSGWGLAYGRALEVLRATPAGRIAGVATVTAIMAWLDGDCLRASAAVDRALQDDPGYRLATLVDRALRQGAPPSLWQEAMEDLTEQECWQRAGARDD